MGIVSRVEVKDREGIAKQYGYTVLIRKADMDEIVPPFHEFRTAQTTQCGITNGLIALPSVHAISFGAPCDECWKEGSSDGEHAEVEGAAGA